MKLRTKKIWIPFLLLVLLLCASCSADLSAYEKNDRDGYCVSVTFDANGGVFTTNTSKIVDSFQLEQLPLDSEGNAQIALLDPNDTQRGQNNRFKPTKSGYFLAGWYATRTEVTDADGNISYTYADRWDFETDVLRVPTDKTYSSQDSVMVLYAAWVPMFEVEFYSISDGTLLSSYTYDPSTAEEALQVPQWNVETGTMDMHSFPTVKGYTFSGVYYDAAGSNPVTTETISLPGSVDYTTGAAQNGTLKLYLAYTQGEWYHIYTAKQFVEHANVNGCYEIYADLDFSDEIWPTSFVYNNFSGTIHGNGHTLSNIQVVQTNNSKVNAGLFGCLTDQAQIRDLHLENVSVTIQAGTRVNGTRYGLFAGTISDNATVENVSIADATLYIDSGCYFGGSDYVIGLVCGMGNSELIPDAQIDCKATGDAPENVKITLSGDQVTVEILTP